MEHRLANSAWTLVFAAWVVACLATLGALFFSEVMEVPPCVLCWYQRIFVFPLAFLLPLGLFPFDRHVIRYALPLVVVGWFIALFHVLLVAGFIPERIKPCTQGVPCSQQQLVLFGFLDIPWMSLIAFSTLIALLASARLRSTT